MEVRNHSKTDLNVCVSEASSVPSRCSAEESTVESAADDRKVQAQHNADSGYYSWGTMSNTATAVCSASESCSITTVNATCYDNGLAYSPVCACCTNGQVTRSSSSLLHKGLPTYPSDSMHQLHGTHYDSNGNLVPQFPAGSTYRNACCVSACITTTPSVDQSSRSRDFVYTKPSLSVNNDIKNGIENHEAETLDLAVKIEFCLKFGFSTRQIRAAITKLSHKATKNDIISELFNCSAPESGSGTLIPRGPPSIDLSIDERAFQMNEKFGLVPKGISDILDTSAHVLQSRGPLTTGIEHEVKGTSKPDEDDSQNLRPIVIDGSNVAMSHGNKQCFSCKGILLAVDYFRMRNHRDITVFIPQYRKESPRPDAPITDREILDQLERERILVYTPSRCINGKRVTCYDDRFILRLAEETDGVIVSNDNFRDLQNEKQQWKQLIEKRLLMYSFVNDRFMPPDDPLGRNGPSIDNFLRKRPASEEQSKPQCPYGKRCTYGKKCKYFHPECSSSQKSVTEQIKEKSEKRVKQTSTEALELAKDLLPTFSSQDGSTQTTHSKESRTRHGKLGVNSDPGVHGSGKHFPSNEHIDGIDAVASTSTSTSQRRSNPGHSQSHVQHSRSSLAANNSYPGRYPGIGPSAYPFVGPTPVMSGSDHNQFHLDSMSDSFRQMNVSNSSPSHSKSLMANAPYPALRSHHPGDSQRLPSPHHPPHANHPLAPPQHPSYRCYADSHDIHSDGPRTLVQQNIPPGPYQHSSPAGFQIFDGMQAQHMNLPGHYQPIPNHYQRYPGQHVYQPVHYGRDGPYPSHPHQFVYQFQGAPAPYINPCVPTSSQGSGSSLSRSIPAVPSAEQQRSYGSDADPKTYPPPAGPRRPAVPYPSNEPLRHNPQNIGAGRSAPYRQSAVPHVPTDQSLGDPENPRHNLFKNLCGLFPRVTVERVMSLHPELSEPKKLIKLCLEESES